MALYTVGMMSISEILGNTSLKHFASSGEHHHLAGGLAAYGFVLYFLVKSFTFGNLLYVSAMWEGMITVLSSLFAIFVLGERFNHWIQYAGILVGLLAVYMVHLGGVAK